MNPTDWYLFSFTEKFKPNSCLSDSCLCICDKIFDDPLRRLIKTPEERQASECSDNGRCLKVKNLNSFEPIEILSPKESLNKISINNSDNKLIIKKLE